MKRSAYRLIGMLLCSIMAALSFYLVTRLNWTAIPLGSAAIMSAFMIGRKSVLAVGIAFVLILIGQMSYLPYYLDFAASRIFSLDRINIADGGSLSGRYLLNSGFLGSSRRVIAIEGEPLALDDFQQRSAFYLPELSRGACRNAIIRITRWASVIDSRCEDAAGPDR